MEGVTMPSYDIPQLKAQQDELNRQAENLIAQVTQFRDAIIRGLHNFTTAAKDVGLMGVSDPVRHEYQGNYVQVNFQLNFYQFSMFISDDVLLQWPENTNGPLGSTPYTSKIFIYNEYSGNENDFPSIVITMQKKQDREYGYEIHGFSGAEREPHPLVSGDSLTSSEGQEVAECIINHYYGAHFYWGNDPKRSEVAHTTVNRPIGFKAL